MSSAHARDWEEGVMTGSSHTRELAHRATDGVEVALLWYPSNDVVSVQVVDSKAGEAFELVLDDHESPLDVFRHPYAYAAQRGLQLGAFSRDGELLAA